MLTASEAVFGFADWLRTRTAELQAEFCRANELPPPREGWDKELILRPET